MTYQLSITKTTNKKAKPNFNDLGFGKYFTDHMFLMNYKEGKGWHNERIVPYGPLEFDPSTMVFHYGQSVFEGLKAYRIDENKAFLFRPTENLKRINISNDRLCIPRIDEDLILFSIKKLISIDFDWIPDINGTSLYIRPFIIATENHLGVKPSDEYLFIIILSPVGAYYSHGINPVKIHVETNYVRSIKGGVGFAKTAGNYAASLKAQMDAHKLGYTQVLWLDAIHRKYIEEVGTMNVFFKIDDEIITPELEGSILPGVTRSSVIELLKLWGMNIKERKISIDEVSSAFKSGRLKEAFGTGTAAVISPISELNYNNEKIIINNEEIGELCKILYSTITDIQSGKVKDKFNWIIEVNK